MEFTTDEIRKTKELDHKWGSLYPKTVEEFNIALDLLIIPDKKSIKKIQLSVSKLFLKITLWKIIKY